VSFRLIFHPDARTEYSESVHWYKASAGKDIARSFNQVVREATRAISANPFRFPVLENEVRHLVLARFPYSVLYTIEADNVVIVSVFHQRRDPIEWRRRL
jgi:plasmid stabilization system protein ParE